MIDKKKVKVDRDVLLAFDRSGAFVFIKGAVIGTIIGLVINWLLDVYNYHRK